MFGARRFVRPTDRSNGLSVFNDKTSLKINGAGGQPGQPFQVFQISRLFQIIRFPLYIGGHIRRAGNRLNSRKALMVFLLPLFVLFE
jgi:hypothetical protein